METNLLKPVANLTVMGNRRRKGKMERVLENKILELEEKNYLLVEALNKQMTKINQRTLRDQPKTPFHSNLEIVHYTKTNSNNKRTIRPFKLLAVGFDSMTFPEKLIEESDSSLMVQLSDERSALNCLNKNQVFDCIIVSTRSPLVASVNVIHRIRMVQPDACILACGPQELGKRNEELFRAIVQDFLPAPLNHMHLMNHLNILNEKK